MAEFETAITLLGSSLQDNEKRTPLHAAAYLGDTEILELLILSGKVIIEEKDYAMTHVHRTLTSVLMLVVFACDRFPHTYHH